MKRVAITGGIAEGKSTVLSYVRELGYSVDSADRIAREVFVSVGVQRQLGDLLGQSPPIAPDTLREALHDDVIRRAANAVTHPSIMKRILDAESSFVEIPLLIEACLQGAFESVWVVTCGPDEQFRRLTERMGDEVAASALIRTQLTSRAKIPFADRLIRTNESEANVKRCVTLAAQREML